ncbi:hypothetical protein A3A79_00310 [Candidatus Gottesmanbacteria bacterium RIFCSPLOWO2_01_FULL_43_11b]|uniref:Uncharacterized protein n=1 Tax=Candidatus Gottesmanbacteria bacterium RIFCSPLOWO2_01_FULL_43_11b TaxID=1798392 RepID=A0A1F6AH95_9BACT|nr:MAG: hypothetical protein A3A79_00310 [Candidatus Gottesmanbacteria bacterium RIFCSPLOWO2_01_FULL_43_11b]
MDQNVPEEQSALIEPIQETPPVPKKSEVPKIVIISSLVLLAVTIIAIGVVSWSQSQREIAQPTPTPVPPTPTPVRILSKVATESAFMQFEESTASLSALMSGYTIIDSTLSLPNVQSSPLDFGKP